MRKDFYALAMVVAIVAIIGPFVAAEKAIRENDRPFIPEQPHTVRYLKSTHKTTTMDEDEEKARAGPLNSLKRLNSLFRSDRNKMKEVKLHKRSATEAFSKVKALMGLSKTPTKVTPTQVNNLETYARSNPEKWDAMTYYLYYVYGMTLVVFMVGGAIYLGWRFH